MLQKKIIGLALAAGVLALLLPASSFAQEPQEELVVRMAASSWYNTVKPGEEKTLYLEVINAGDRTLTGVRFSADQPEGWTVSFQPAVIAYLEVDDLRTVDVNILVPARSGKGDHNITLIAEADGDIKRVTSTTMRVEAVFSVWLWAGVALAVLVTAGFAFIFLRYGRR